MHEMETKNSKTSIQWNKDLVLWKDKQIHKHNQTNQKRETTKTIKINSGKGTLQRTTESRTSWGKTLKSYIQDDEKCSREKFLHTYDQPKLNHIYISGKTEIEVVKFPTKEPPELDRVPANSTRLLKKCARALQIIPQNPKGRMLPAVVLLTGSRLPWDVIL